MFGWFFKLFRKLPLQQFFQSFHDLFAKNDDFWSPLATQADSKISPGTDLFRPKATKNLQPRMRGSVSEPTWARHDADLTPKAHQNDHRINFHRFGLHFESIFGPQRTKSINNSPPRSPNRSVIRSNEPTNLQTNKPWPGGMRVSDWIFF